MPPPPVILWIRSDLRLADHPALRAAADSGRPLLPVFIVSPSVPSVDDADRPIGAGSRAWLRASLAALDHELRALGSRLILRRGPAAEALTALINQTGAESVFWNDRTEPDAPGVSSDLAARLRSHGLDVQVFPASWLRPPGEILSGQGTPYRVFTPFSRACFDAEEPPPPLPAPRKWTSPARWPASDPLGSLLPASGDEPRIPASLTPGFKGAHARLRAFIKSRLDDYPEARDRIDADGTSSLAPHLHFGELTAREIWYAVRTATADAPPNRRKAAHAFLRQILWREFALLSLREHPDMATQPIQPRFADFGWRRDARALEAWKSGRTGYPIVDAAMRELAATGCMHNRLRMIVASFLCKHLLIHWSEGERWFWEKLLDADAANNAFGWQWVAGCGLDAAPFIRVFNPVLQGRKFDPEGAYVARWLPELAALGANLIHEPWRASPRDLQLAGIRLGETYPEPLVDHAAARTRALHAFESFRSVR